MKILSTSQIRAWDAFTIKNEPILSIDLMERASGKLFLWIKKRYKTTRSFVIFSGMGNNGGDALALARLLFLDGYSRIKVVVLKTGLNYSEDCEINLERLKTGTATPVFYIDEGDDFPELLPDDVVIDGIFGSGLTRPVSGYWGALFSNINNSNSHVISIDIPSGLLGDGGGNATGAIIKASFTLTFQVPKLAFFFVDNFPFIGHWYVLDINLLHGFEEEVETDWYFSQAKELKGLLKRRKPFDHKGIFGHAFLVAGSYRQNGAAVLAAKACLRSGVGLLTVHVPESGREIMQIAVPEAMVCIDETEFSYCEPNTLAKYAALGIGPGVGKKQSVKTALKRLLENNTKPLVIDADALNILAENRDWLSLLPKNTILTPHPGEFDRLTKRHSTSFDRWKSQLAFSKEYKVIIVLKGRYTSISDALGNTYFNSSGNPGMATAGSGDVLTGIILSLLAQAYKPFDAAILGVYLHGLSGDFAAKKKGVEALIASDIINCLGKAFKKLQKD